jgi:hypothetical protein
MLEILLELTDHRIKNEIELLLGMLLLPPSLLPWLVLFDFYWSVGRKNRLSIYNILIWHKLIYTALLDIPHFFPKKLTLTY